MGLWPQADIILKYETALGGTTFRLTFFKKGILVMFYSYI